jgi:5-methylcytosine-specific restriction endonuclease McrA
MSASQLLQRPIYGGAFGDDGRYSLASVPCVSHGLHATRYMVVQPQAGLVLSVSEDKTEALALARKRLSAANDKHQPPEIAKEQGELWPDEPLLSPVPSPAPYVARRRREIFERSQGRCHYCRTPIELFGKWHIEHQLPRALGGGDDTLNLVAACVPCNLRKSDSTAIEFVTQSASAA